MDRNWKACVRNSSQDLDGIASGGTLVHSLDARRLPTRPRPQVARERTGRHPLPHRGQLALPGRGLAHDRLRRVGNGFFHSPSSSSFHRLSPIFIRETVSFFEFGFLMTFRDFFFWDSSSVPRMFWICVERSGVHGNHFSWGGRRAVWSRQEVFLGPHVSSPAFRPPRAPSHSFTLLGAGGNGVPSRNPFSLEVKSDPEHFVGHWAAVRRGGQGRVIVDVNHDVIVRRHDATFEFVDLQEAQHRQRENPDDPESTAIRLKIKNKINNYSRGRQKRR